MLSFGDTDFCEVMVGFLHIFLLLGLWCLLSQVTALSFDLKITFLNRKFKLAASALPSLWSDPIALDKGLFCLSVCLALVCLLSVLSRIFASLRHLPGRVAFWPLATLTFFSLCGPCGSYLFRRCGRVHRRQLKGGRAYFSSQSQRTI